MTPTVDVCNLALTHVGQAATISAVDPPEGSVYAELCAAMYPLALGALLETHPWGFATITEQLAPLAATRPGWAHAFAEPAHCLRIWNLSATADGVPVDFERQGAITPASPVVICTNTPTAVVRYTKGTLVPQILPPLVKVALSYWLASMIVGSIVKGQEGAAASAKLLESARAYALTAAASDANQSRQTAPAHAVPWVSGRT